MNMVVFISTNKIPPAPLCHCWKRKDESSRPSFIENISDQCRQLLSIQSLLGTGLHSHCVAQLFKRSSPHRGNRRLRRQPEGSVLCLWARPEIRHSRVSTQILQLELKLRKRSIFLHRFSPESRRHAASQSHGQPPGPDPFLSPRANISVPTVGLPSCSSGE